MEEIFILRAIFAASVVAFEVPSGYLSDLLGRKRTLILAGFFMGAAFTCLNLGSSFILFVVFHILNAIAISLFSGTDVALIYDTTAQLVKKSGSNTKILGKRIFYSQFGETCAALLGGLLAGYSLTLPAKANAITAWVPFLIAFTLIEPERVRMTARKHFDNFKYILRTLMQESRLLRLIIFNYIFLALASYISVWAFQGYWGDIGIPLMAFGYLWAAYNLTVAITGRLAHLIERRLGSVTLLIMMAILPVAGFAGMGVFASWLGVIFGFLFQICRGLNQVIMRDALNTRIGSDMRATANSLASLGVRMAFVVMGPLMGYLIDAYGYRSTFLSFSGFYLFLMLLLTVPLLRKRQQFRPVE